MVRPARLARTSVLLPCLWLAWAQAVAGERARATALAQPDPAALRAALRELPAGAMLVRMAAPPGNQALVAMRVAAPAARVRALIADPSSYPRAVPALVRAQVLRESIRRDGGAGATDRQVAWELELPGSNPSGRLWLKPFGAVVQVRLTEGAFAPGELRFRVEPGEDAGVATPETSLLVLEASLDAHSGNWVTRTLASREALAQPAITVSAALVLLRALAILAAPDEARAIRRPAVPATPPLPSRLDARPLLAAARALGGADEPIGAVLTAAGGRLDHAQVAWTSATAPVALLDALADPQAWTALPGWRRIGASTAVRAREADAAPMPTYAQRWEVRSSFPFVSFEALWEVTRGQGLRAVSARGPGAGAVWGWDVAAAPPGDQGSVAVMSLHPRLDRLGFLPRKFIEHEPLLEHALSFALAYVDAVALLRRVGAVTWPAPRPPSPADRMDERARMVQTQIAARGVRAPEVLRALGSVPRHRFVPEERQPAAYEDRPLPIGSGQTISQPYIVALMTELAEVSRGARVLEIGTGSGYQTAILAALGAEVYSVEIVPELAARAARALASWREGAPEAGPIALRTGDGYQGWPEAAPFDAIVVTAAPPAVPQPLVDQLKVGGRLVIPIGDGEQTLRVLTRTATGLDDRKIIPVRFVPMTGRAQAHPVE